MLFTVATSPTEKLETHLGACGTKHAGGFDLPEERPRIICRSDNYARWKVVGCVVLVEMEAHQVEDVAMIPVVETHRVWCKKLPNVECEQVSGPGLHIHRDVVEDSAERANGCFHVVDADDDLQGIPQCRWCIALPLGHLQGNEYGLQKMGGAERANYLPQPGSF